MKILVISSCSGWQQIAPAPAAELYIGTEHQWVMQGVRAVRRNYGEEALDLRLLSTKHGILEETDVIAPYDVPVTDSSISRGLREEIMNLTADYDLVFFLLGWKHHRKLRLNQSIKESSEKSVTRIFLVANAALRYTPDDHGRVLLDRPEMTEFGGPRLYKGGVFKNLCQTVCRKGFSVFEDVKRNPKRIIALARESLREA